MSVKDGRYEEQKFRMKSCGLTQLHYLIEDYPIKKNLWGGTGGNGGIVTTEAIEQAVANTAVQQGFTVKKTRDKLETIEYLTLVTRLLVTRYSKLELSSCTRADLDGGLAATKQSTLLTFAEFNESCKKNRQYTAGEVWAKMLLRLKGLSVEIAQSITGQYPTAAHLLAAYTTCPTAEQRVKLISSLTYGLEGKKKIPKGVAETLNKFWTDDRL